MPNELQLPDFDLPGQTKAFDLLDWTSLTDVKVRTSLGLAILEGLPVALQKYMKTVIIKREIEALAPLIKTAVEGRRVGYLIRVNLYAQDSGVIFSPAGSVISAVGIGLEPIDALAEAYRAPSIQNNKPNGLRDESHYIWFNERKAIDGRLHLIATNIPSVVARDFEKRAWEEAQVRDLVQASYITPAPELLKRVQQATFWSDVLTQRIAAVNDLRQREEITALNDRFSRAQDRFNNAYEGYQKIEREMAAHAREIAVIDKIDAVLSLLKKGAEEYAERSTRNTSASTAASSKTPPPINNGTISLWRHEREKIVENVKQTIIIEVRESALKMRSAQDQLRVGWSKTGVPIPAEPVLQIDLP